ncbi:MAG: ABC transporter substrate-binding protein [Haloglomus sp.]
MGDDSSRGVSRRNVLTTGAGLVGAALLAGCTGDGGSGDGDASPTGASPTDTSPTSTSPTDTSYTVSMAPTGEVTFDSTPTNVTNYFPGYADMAVALGHGDSINSVGIKSRYHTDTYDELDGVSIDKNSLTALYQGGIDTEVFYSLGGDLHLIDPNWLLNNFSGFEQADIDELAENVAPFFGNVIFRRTDSWHDYRYYTMYEAFQKVAQVYQEQERFQAFKSFHDDFIARVQADLPPATERPNGLLCFAAGNEPELFYPYRLSDKGTNKKQFHDLGISDALAGSGVEGLSTNDRGQIDYEAMLEVDPDSILIRGHETKTRAEFQNTVLAFMRDHDTASELTAVQEGNVFRGGPIYEGPIQNLFLTERFASAYFPETYSGTLFDRGEVSGIITGTN